jgi:ABC-type methionine transport system permease subunit
MARKGRGPTRRILEQQFKDAPAVVETKSMSLLAALLVAWLLGVPVAVLLFVTVRLRLAERRQAAGAGAAVIRLTPAGRGRSKAPLSA